MQKMQVLGCKSTRCGILFIHVRFVSICLTASPDCDGVGAAGRPGLQHCEPDLAHRRLPRRAQEDPRHPQGQERREGAEDGHPRQRRLHLLQGST